METLFKNKIYRVVFVAFIIVSLIHIIYATVTCRALYLDGSFYLISQLNNLGIGDFNYVINLKQTRFFMMMLLQLPVMISYHFLFVKSKFVLMLIYSFTQFILPFAALMYNFYLTKRTGRIDVLFWNLFTYGTILSLFMIFPSAEIFIGVTFNFILWNYLVSKIEYKISDIAVIVFLVMMMFGTHEYIIFVAPLIFILHFFYFYDGISEKSAAMKRIIGWGSLSAALFNIIYMFGVSGEAGEIVRYLEEAVNVLPNFLKFNSLFSVVAVVLLIIFFFYRRKIQTVGLFFILAAFNLALFRLLKIAYFSVNPMWEGHYRAMPCYTLFFIFLIMFLTDYVKQKRSQKLCDNTDVSAVNSSGRSDALIVNSFCIITVCCIFQMFWQINHTYLWDKNIKYMKSELANCGDILYIPSEHEEISTFWNKDFRKYIWHSVYTSTSILFSDSYKPKSLLMHYDEEYDENNHPFRDSLFVPKNSKNIIVIPVNVPLYVKNEFWDLTDFAEALDKYNSENNIKTMN